MNFITGYAWVSACAYIHRELEPVDGSYSKGGKQRFGGEFACLQASNPRTAEGSWFGIVVDTRRQLVRRMDVLKHIRDGVYDKKN